MSALYTPPRKRWSFCFVGLFRRNEPRKMPRKQTKLKRHSASCRLERSDKRSIAAQRRPVRVTQVEADVRALCATSKEMVFLFCRLVALFPSPAARHPPHPHGTKSLCLSIGQRLFNAPSHPRGGLPDFMRCPGCMRYDAVMCGGIPSKRAIGDHPYKVILLCGA